MWCARDKNQSLILLSQKRYVVLLEQHHHYPVGAVTASAHKLVLDLVHLRVTQIAFFKYNTKLRLSYLEKV
jgi:hypothetical protein